MFGLSVLEGGDSRARVARRSAEQAGLTRRSCPPAKRLVEKEGAHFFSRVRSGRLDIAAPRRHRSRVVVYTVVDPTLSLTSPRGDSIEVFVRREDAQRFVDEIRGDDPELASQLRIEERKLEAGGRN